MVLAQGLSQVKVKLSFGTSHLRAQLGFTHSPDCGLEASIILHMSLSIGLLSILIT